MIFPAINLHLWLGFSKAMLNNYNVGPPSYKLVYKPHEYYSYRYYKP